MKTLTILLITMLALSTTCPAIGKRKRAVMDSWIGNTKHRLIVSWGPPDRIADDGDGDGGQIIIYSRLHTDMNRRWYVYKMFYTHTDGTIYAWRISKENVPPQEYNVRLFVY